MSCSMQKVLLLANALSLFAYVPNLFIMHIVFGACNASSAFCITKETSTDQWA